jgi:hypothetical protein
VHVRDCVPDVSQVLEKPPHAPNAVHVDSPQLAPSVVRMHGSISITGWSTHLPSLHTWSTQLRVMVPVSAQASAYMHMANGSHDRGAQPQSPESPAFVLREVDCASALAASLDPPSIDEVDPTLSPTSPPSGHRVTRDGSLWKSSLEEPS